MVTVSTPFASVLFSSVTWSLLPWLSRSDVGLCDGERITAGISAMRSYLRVASLQRILDYGQGTGASRYNLALLILGQNKAVTPSNLTSGDGPVSPRVLNPRPRV